jgi:molybdopterin molybdotransferase
VVLPERARGWDVRRAGEVFREGQLVAEAGERLTAERMALLYTAGIEEVVVHPPVEVAVLPTGSELLHPGQRGGPGMIRGGNGPMLAALVEEAGGRLALSQAVRDEEEELRRALAGASECSRLVLTTGGVSVGGKDLVPRTLQELGAEQIARGVGIKPGRPTMLAKLGDAWVLALPGHPISALVGWRMIGWRLLRRLAGERGALGEGHLSARLVNTARNRGGSPGFFPAKLERTSEGAVVHRLETRGPHDVLALARANSLVQVEPGQALEAGSLVPVHPFAPLERTRTPQEEAHGGA